MVRPEERVKQALHEGESIREAFDVGPARIIVTSHRVFVAQPDEAGIQQAELINVTGVTRTTRGSRSGLLWGGALALLGGILFVAALAVRGSAAFDPPEFDESAAEEVGAGPLIDLVGAVLWLVENLDVLLLWSGGFFLALAALLVAYYWVVVREQCLTIERAGARTDIDLPLEHIPAGEERRLRETLGPEQVSDDSPKG